MTKLLVSVRSAAEARAALRGGCDLIDVKEPARGALGFADGSALCEIAAVVGQQVPLSAALGEIDDAMPPKHFSALANFRFAKLGLAGARDLDDWAFHGNAIINALPSQVSPVAVMYADWTVCRAPSPSAIFTALEAFPRRCAALLIDTYTKQGATLFDFISTRELADIFSEARAGNLPVVVAGSLKREQLAQVAALSPDMVAVRGSVCTGGRGGTIDARLVAQFRAELARHSHRELGSAKSASRREFA